MEVAELARQYFPFFHNQPQELSNWILFDNSGGTQCLKVVGDRIRDYLFQTNVSCDGEYEVAKWSQRRLKEGIRAATMFMNAKSEREICLGPSAAQLLHWLGESMDDLLNEGDEIIVTNCDHEANIGPWMELAEKKKCKLHEWKVNPKTFLLQASSLEEMLTSKTKLVCFAHVSNILGSINPVKEISKMVRDKSKEAMIVVDGVAYAPHRAIDVQDFDVDFYVISFYKIFGPHLSVMYGKEQSFSKLKNINHFFFNADDIPGKIQIGGVNPELSYGIPGIVEYLIEMGSTIQGLHSTQPTSLELIKIAFLEIAKHEEMLVEKLVSYLLTKDAVTLIGSADHLMNVRVSIISFVVRGLDSADVVAHLETSRIGARSGSFHADRLVSSYITKINQTNSLQAVNKHGVIRISMVHYNSVQEVQMLITALEAKIPPNQPNLKR